jgi:hypothetical protein
MKRKCLKCNKEFEAKKETAKYCSVSCRVMFNRKVDKKEKVEKEKSLLMQTQVLLNSVVEMVGKINYGVVPTNFDAPQMNNITHNEPRQWQEPILSEQKKTPQEWVLEKRDADTPEAYNAWFKRLEACDYLTKEIKSSIKQS